MEASLKTWICKQRDATSDLQQPEVALHRPLCNLVLKFELVNTKTLHPTCNIPKGRYIGPCATLSHTLIFKTHDATCDLKIFNRHYIGPCATLSKNMKLSTSRRCMRPEKHEEALHMTLKIKYEHYENVSFTYWYWPLIGLAPPSGGPPCAPVLFMIW